MQIGLRGISFYYTSSSHFCKSASIPCFCQHFTPTKPIFQFCALHKLNKAEGEKVLNAIIMVIE
jgi:hypothetical protein